MAATQKITTQLWFVGNAEAAVEFYTSVFPDSRVTNITRWGEGGPGPEGAVLNASRFRSERADVRAFWHRRRSLCPCHTSPPPGESLQRTDTQGGIEVGGGATIWLSGTIGLRTAATYFKALGPPGDFHGAPGSGLVYTNVLRDLSLTRVTVGLDFRLSRSNRAAN